MELQQTSFNEREPELARLRGLPIGASTHPFIPKFKRKIKCICSPPPLKMHGINRAHHKYK